MKFNDKPRWMVWPHMILEEAKRVGIIIFYNGEGCDEIFGYQDSYLKGWADLIEYHLPCWTQSAKNLGINLITPFKDLETSLVNNEGLPVTLSLHYGTKKKTLWDSYRHLIPSDLVTYPKEICIPTYYKILGLTKEHLLIEATKRWLESKMNTQ